MAESLTPRQLQSDYALQEQFLAWYATTSYATVGDPLLMCEKGQVLPRVWQQFLKSRQAPVTVAKPAASTQPTPAPQPTKAYNPETMQCPQCGCSRDPDAILRGTTLCTVCIHNAKKASTPQPLSQPATIAPVSTPVPAAPVNRHATPTVIPPGAPTLPGSSNPLISLIADGLRDMGFSPERSVTAEQARTIADDAALSVADMVVEQLKSEGLLGVKHVIEMRQDGQVVRQIKGRPPVWFDEALALCECRVPVFLVGPAGCGKTTGARMIAKALGLSYTRVSISAGVDEGIVQGWLLPIQAGGQFCYVPAPFVKAYREGGLVLVDEFDAGDANMLVIMSAVFDEDEWHIPLDIETPHIRKHDDFVGIAAANTFGHGANKQFSAANKLDERTLSRFRQGQIACDYDEDLERETFDTGVVDFGHRLRQRCRGLDEFGRDVSTRDIALNSRKVVSGRFSVEQAWFAHFADWQADELHQVHAKLDRTARTVALA